MHSYINLETKHIDLVDTYNRLLKDYGSLLTEHQEVKKDAQRAIAQNSDLHQIIGTFMGSYEKHCRSSMEEVEASLPDSGNAQIAKASSAGDEKKD